MVQIGNTVTSLTGAFYQAVSLATVPTSIPSSVTDLSYAFFGDTSFNSSNISSWGVGNVTNFTSTFQGATVFNQDLSTWDTHSATNMTSMFNGALAFNNGGASGVATTAMDNAGTGLGSKWDVTHVTNFTSMFNGASSFNSSISGWGLGSSGA